MPIIVITPTTPTAQQQQQQARADALKRRINAKYQEVVSLADEAARFVWATPAKAQSQFALFGANAADLCKVSAAFAALVATIAGTAPAIVPAGYTVTPNVDGTVTVAGPTPTPTPTP